MDGGAPERMEIVAGAGRVTFARQDHPAGASFDVPGRSGFTLAVAGGLCEYLCSFL